MADNKEKLVQLKDRDLQTLLYPKITGGSIPERGVTKDKLSTDLQTELAGDLTFKVIKEL